MVDLGTREDSQMPALSPDRGLSSAQGGILLVNPASTSGLPAESATARVVQARPSVAPRKARWASA
jgi:hypothetical protein